jgi:hypothetical protein
LRHLRDSHPLRSPLPAAFGWQTGFLLGDWPAVQSRWPATPMRHRQQPVPPHRFGLLPVRSPLLREYSLFLGVLRCFSSPGSLLRAYVFSTGSSGITRMGLPHSDILGSLPTRGSPRPFAAWSRPSSAPDAKASTVCSSRESACSSQFQQNQHYRADSHLMSQHRHTHTFVRDHLDQRFAGVEIAVRAVDLHP